MNPGRFPRAQRGAALLTAMIIVVLIVTLSASMVWQQWRAVQVETAERARTQAEWILTGALDWARLILREDARNNKPTALTEPWATPLAEARLSTFLAADKSNAEDAPDAFLSGAIADVQSRLNLRNLVDAQGKPVAAQVQALERLCQAVGLSSDVATRIATGLRDSSSPPSASGGTGNAPLRPNTVEQLRWFGLDAETVQRLAPYVALLPVARPVNVNTAPREVLAAAMDIDFATAERLVQMRQRQPFKDLAAVTQQVPGKTFTADQIDVRSSYFEVRGRLRLADRILEQRSLVERRGIDHVVLQRELVASREAGGG